MTRKNSDLHEAQLNVKLLKPMGHSGNISLKELSEFYEMNVKGNIPDHIHALIAKDKFGLIIHPKSHSSAREWSLDNFSKLVQHLSPEKYQIIITGGEKEADDLNKWHKSLPEHVLNLAGKLSLEQLIALINTVDGIVAASTGPLHIAAALGKHALGIYPPIRPMDPGRWAPVGKNAEFIVLEKSCSDCRFDASSCHCINEVKALSVAERIAWWSKK
jgi:ADP-heptose:LPS heptosyltransferase